VRSNYTDDEVRALVEIKALLSGEITRLTTLAATYLQHLIPCADAEHRGVIARKAADAVSSVLQHLRYCSWLEAELTQGRVFTDPAAILAELIEQQTEMAELSRAKQEPEPEVLGPNTVVGDTPHPKDAAGQDHSPKGDEGAASLVHPPAPAAPSHTDHPLRHWDRTCPACLAEAMDVPTPETKQ
jgi:hypothetical protein